MLGSLADQAFDIYDFLVSDHYFPLFLQLVGQFRV